MFPNDFDIVIYVKTDYLNFLYNITNKNIKLDICT